MKARHMLSAAAMAAVMTAAVSVAQAAEHAPAMEKCFGVAKASKNDCAAGAHSCAGHAAADSDAHEYVKLPAGTCDKIVGGSTKEPEKK